jgi:nitrogen regulatory protein PII
MKYSHQKLIISILPKGAGREVLQVLRKDHGIKTGNINMARGAGMYNPLDKRGVGEQSEKEMLTVVVSTEQADEVFAYIYEAARIDEPHRGIIFQSDLKSSSQYTLPTDLAEEKA